VNYWGVDILCSCTVVLGERSGKQAGDVCKAMKEEEFKLGR
jgi:hypothetical protein